MAPRVVIYVIDRHRRSEMVAGAMAAGIAKAGETSRIVLSTSYREPVGDIALFYGYDTNLRTVFKDYIAAGKTVVFFDLGYWARRIDGRYDGYHKLGINSRHPNGYFTNRRHDNSRFAALGIDLKPWRRRGSHILLAGMAPKAAEAEGMVPYAWERWAATEIRKHTDRQILFRPKPGALSIESIPGTTLAPQGQELDEALADCWAVVSHHSNTNVDALVAGVPSFCLEGAALSLSCSDFSKVESPHYPDGREQWAADLAWCQWTAPEMIAGLPWRHLKAEGLIP